MTFNFVTVLLPDGFFVLLFPGAPYQIDQLANESRNQPKLSSFFTSKTYSDAEDAANNAICHVIPEIEDSTLRGGKLKEAPLSEVDDLIKNTRQFSGESNNPVQENFFESSIEEPTSSCGNFSDFKMAGVGKADTENQSAVKNESSPLRPSTSAASYCLDDKGVKGSTSFTVLGPSNQRHSTAEDPNFVENYFKVFWGANSLCTTFLQNINGGVYMLIRRILCYIVMH